MLPSPVSATSAVTLPSCFRNSAKAAFRVVLREVRGRDFEVTCNESHATAAAHMECGRERRPKKQPPAFPSSRSPASQSRDRAWLCAPSGGRLRSPSRRLLTVKAARESVEHVRVVSAHYRESNGQPCCGCAQLFDGDGGPRGHICPARREASRTTMMPKHGDRLRQA